MTEGAALSRFALARQRFELEPQIFGQRDEPGALLLDPQQRIETDGVGGDELVELDDRFLRLCAEREQIRNVGFTQAPCEPHDQPRFLAAGFDSAEHGRQKTQKMIRTTAGPIAMRSARSSPPMVRRSQRAMSVQILRLASLAQDQFTPTAVRRR